MQTSQLFYTKRVTFSILHTYFFNYFILLQFFIIPSLTASLSHRPITTNDHFTPSHHHHPPVTIITTQPTSSRKTNPLNSKLSQSETHSKSTKPETHWWSKGPSFDDLIGMVWWSVCFDDRRGLMIGVVWWSAAMDDRQSTWFDYLFVAMVWRSATMEAWFDQMKKGRVRWDWPKPRDKEREEIIKIINASATVTVHICTITVAIVHLCTILHPLM